MSITLSLYLTLLGCIIFFALDVHLMKLVSSRNEHIRFLEKRINDLETVGGVKWKTPPK